MTRQITWLIVDANTNEIIGDRFYTAKEAVQVLSGLQAVQRKLGLEATYQMFKKVRE